MVIYYHTRRHIFAVTNGFCSAVVDLQGQSVFTNLVGSKLLACVSADMRDESAPEMAAAGMLLMFAIGSSTMTTDQITKVETVTSLSIPPSPRSIPPESRRDDQPRATLPEIIIMPKTPGLPS
jgi:hypothetical protein